MNPDPTSLDRLHDVIIPPPVPFWPPTPGWSILGGLLIVLVLVVLLRLVADWQANRYRREAVRELNRHKDRLDEPGRTADFVIAMAVLLKRAALTAFPRERVAALSGAKWLLFLDKTGKTNSFSTGLGQWLEKVAYDPRCASSIKAEDVRQLEIMVRHWLSHHRVDLATGEQA